MKKILVTVLCFAIVISCFLSSCTPFDTSYGESVNDTSSANKYKNVKVPEIKSDDEQMPTFFDISLYDEENYSEIYLGKKFEYKITYAGSDFKVPSSVSKMKKLGWELVSTDKYNADTQIMAGKTLKANFKNQYGKQIVAKFFNDRKSSVSLEDCDIVKFTVPENVYMVPDSVYGQFFVNGVSNESAITDVIEYLGAPSHFYAVSATQYYLDYFISKDDKRCGITVYIDIPSDSVTAIEFANY